MILLGALPVVSVTMHTPGVGAWVADVSLDLEAGAPVPSGRTVLTIAGAPFAGTVDDRASGKAGLRASVRLVAGGAGWPREVKAKHFQNDFGVLSSAVASVTAAEVGETVVDAAPVRYSADYVRTAGPASRVLEGRPWYVDASGVTIIGERPPGVAPKSLELLEWDPIDRRLSFACDEVLSPGLVLEDARFGGRLKIRDVRQTFGEDGAKGIAWCEPDASASALERGGLLVRALASLARESSGASSLKRYRYRVLVQGADLRVTLQAVTKTSGAPDFLKNIPIWPGLPGVEVRVAPGTEVAVAFLDGDPTRPVVAGFGAGAPEPLELVIQGARVQVGGSLALGVVRGGAPAPSPPGVDWFTQVTAAINGIASGSVTAPTPSISTTLFSE